jgi:hypothetical protein
LKNKFFNRGFALFSRKAWLKFGLRQNRAIPKKGKMKNKFFNLLPFSAEKHGKSFDKLCVLPCFERSSKLLTKVKTRQFPRGFEK